MRKLRPVLCVVLSMLTFACKANSLLATVYGTKPRENSVGVGSLVYHFLHPRNQLFFPYLTVSLKNSFIVNLFENSYVKFGLGLGIQRNWYQHDFKNGNGVRLGYMLGIIYGYCCKRGLKCQEGDKFPENMKLIPGIMLYSQYFFSDHIGVSFSWAASIVKVDFVYRLH